MPNVFVYGTLKRGYGLNRVLEEGRAIFIEEGQTCGKYTLYDLGCYPGVSNELGKEVNIKGELYEVSKKLLRRLDSIEGHHRVGYCGYRRHRIHVRLTNGLKVRAWLYFYPHKERLYPDRKVLDGNWVRRDRRES
jgi:gamma-glutamylaminecyclotransferase